MTVYNIEKYIRESIDSVINQTFPHWELILIDNGSSDSTLDIIQEYKDKRIKLFKLKKNIGRTQALCFAFEKAKSEFIAILDGDDVAHPERFQCQYNFLAKNQDIHLVATWTYYINEDGKKIAEHSPSNDPNTLRDYFAWSNPIHHSSVMYSKKIAIKLGGYSKDYHWAQDAPLFIRFVAFYKIALIGKFLTKIRIRMNSETRQRENRLVIARERLNLFKLAGELIPFSFLVSLANNGAISLSEIRLYFQTQPENSIRKLFFIIYKITYSAPYIFVYMMYKLFMEKLYEIFTKKN
jgi:glycosyltransferase involved in cell wall biosynthesis